jgi:hypothetical protein
MPLHQPFWCEENVWHLAADPCAGAGERRVLIVSGTSGHVACWQQRAAAPGEPVLWDYHVVMASAGADGWLLWDADSRLGFPLGLAAWLDGTFPAGAGVPEAFRPRFLVVAAGDYRRDLWSDRSHMRRADGGWQRPPPEWPAPLAGRIPLGEYLRRARSGEDLDALRRRFDSV